MSSLLIFLKYMLEENVYHEGHEEHEESQIQKDFGFLGVLRALRALRGEKIDLMQFSELYSSSDLDDSKGHVYEE